MTFGYGIGNGSCTPRFNADSAITSCALLLYFKMRDL
jgi:hypothetical protein